MSLLTSPYRLAAELAPSAWTFAAAPRRRRADAPPVGRTFDPSHADFIETFRAFRAAHRLSADLSAIVWPVAGDIGVSPVDARDASRAAVPKARAVRERIAPLVRAGGLVTALVLPHEAMPDLLRVRQIEHACVLALHERIACLAAVRGPLVDARYLSWDGPLPGDNSRLDFLARYQLAASLAPHVREVLARTDVGAPLAVIGSVRSLRAVAMPLVEELDREIDVFDADMPGADITGWDADDVASLQLSWAVASTAASA